MTTTYEADNRWAPDASFRPPEASEGAVAEYAARWIDRGTHAETVPDRQGFAHDDPPKGLVLIDALNEADVLHDVAGLQADICEQRELPAGDDHTGLIWLRRAGGYIYVDASIYHKGRP